MRDCQLGDPSHRPTKVYADLNKIYQVFYHNFMCPSSPVPAEICIRQSRKKRSQTQSIESKNQNNKKYRSLNEDSSLPR